VVRAVVDGYFEIHDRESGQETKGGGFDNSLLDGGNEIARYRPAEDFVREFELPAARQRLQTNPAVSELPVSAGLLLVTALDVGFASDRFPLRNLGRVQLDIHAVAFL
jgi:hypothetical protein